jgi:formate dehydrogenase major subunit
MSAPANDPGITFELDDELVTAQPGETIWSAARRHGVLIPHLCHSDGLRPDGNCRACVVEIEGERTLAPSCCRTPAPGRRSARKARAPARARDWCWSCCWPTCPSGATSGTTATSPPRPHRRTQRLGRRDWASRSRPALTALAREQPAPDLSHPRWRSTSTPASSAPAACAPAAKRRSTTSSACRPRRHTQVVFDLGDPMGASSCVACGECVQACPTGALMPKSLIGSQKVDRSVDSVCPFCGVGCQITYKVRDEQIVAVRRPRRPGQ